MSPETVQVIVGILTSLSLGLAGWAMKSVVELGKQAAASDALAKAHKEEIDRRIREHKEDTERRFAYQESQTDNKFKDVKDELKTITAGVTAVHKRLDGLITKKAE